MDNRSLRHPRRFPKPPIVTGVAYNVAMKKPLHAVALAAALLLACPAAWPEIAGGSLAVHWNEGAQNCTKNPQPPIQVHEYNSNTFILRENLCATFEGNFIYLLVGSAKALLIDTGDVADPRQMPLAQTVLDLLPGDGPSKLPLLVVHTHRHQDHRAGDPQFAQLSNVQVVAFDLRSVQQYFGFTDWPNGIAHVDIGNRTIDVIPTPGHEASHTAFYDRDTGLLFSGDFLMPGRLLIADTDEDLASATRVANFIKDRPVSHVLGGHIELDLAGEIFPEGSQFHPREHPLQLNREDLLALPAALAHFNGFYTKNNGVILSNPMHNLLALALMLLFALIGLGLLLLRFFRRRKSARVLQALP